MSDYYYENDIVPPNIHFKKPFWLKEDKTENTKKNNRKPKKSPGSAGSNNKRLSSGSSSKSVESDGETGSVQDEQMVPILRREISNHQHQLSRPARNEFAFSDLMRKMASKYQTTKNSSNSSSPSDGATE